MEGDRGHLSPAAALFFCDTATMPDVSLFMRETSARVGSGLGQVSRTDQTLIIGRPFLNIRGCLLAVIVSSNVTRESVTSAFHLFHPQKSDIRALTDK